ncbi:peroxidase family protein [Mastigocoleus sp. MO_188.B34]|uniref:peroxidase family protein n=1 Tax=Mastigocoleus sp. MO_188.B34 TaxID=3036635 RepID=UPI002633B682|nr:peroxidase family protein [Mastigocoleus sp. MO_188.B34]MDJ0695133.1 peroxidase family protein [Mastigocoleus sp. MO_188.B34]
MQHQIFFNNPFLNNDFEVQSFDGTGNNLQNPEYGVTDSALVDIAPLNYGDGFSTPTGEDRPNPREISNAISQQNEDIFDPRGLTNFIWAWGQFLDHDLSLTPEDGSKPVSIPVPAGDPFLDPQNTGNVVIELNDSQVIEGTGTGDNNPKQLPNVITAWIDGSNVYGSDEKRADFLRSFEGGKLKTSEGDLLRFNLPADKGGVENDNPTRQVPTDLFVAGDVRANENAVLSSVHTLFVREHNCIATKLEEINPEWTDEQLFQRARQINIAQMQSITFNEYIPALLGDNALPEYTGYNSEVNPGITRAFSTAAFRLGHTQLSSNIVRLDTEGEVIPKGNLTLSEVFFPGSGVLQEAGIDPILRGISSSQSQQVDNEIIDDVRNLLFGMGPRGSVSARDLAAINIQRGRLNGLADYNTVREAFGLFRVTSFAEITSDQEKQNTLQELYGNVDNIDFFVGMLAEDLLPNASVGESVYAVLSYQFQVLRDGDRFYYENVFTPEEIEIIENTRLADIIKRNTDTTIIQDNVFSLVNKGTSNDDILNGGLGNDTISGLRGDDLIHGYAGEDSLNGNAGDDILKGGKGNDILKGGKDDDILYGNQGDDSLYGNQGDDILKGGKGNDTLKGGKGDDILKGGKGDDLLYGGGGDDRLDGYSTGGTEYDTLVGGNGFDTFVLGDFSGAYYQGESYATIQDWDYKRDFIEVGGNSEQYSLGFDNLSGSSESDTLIYFQDDLIGVIEDSTNVNIFRDFFVI